MTWLSPSPHFGLQLNLVMLGDSYPVKELTPISRDVPSLFSTYYCILNSNRQIFLFGQVNEILDAVVVKPTSEEDESQHSRDSAIIAVVKTSRKQSPAPHKSEVQPFTKSESEGNLVKWNFPTSYSPPQGIFSS